MTQPWAPPPDLWKGRTVAILAGGRSLTQEKADIVRARGWAAIAINDAYKLAPWADVLYAADTTWWTHYYAEAKQFRGLKLHSQEWSQVCDVEYLPIHPKLARGGNSAIHAAVLAFDGGAARVPLLGVDLRDDELTHWHGKHPSPLMNPTPTLFSIHRQTWARAAASLLKGRDVINCNPRSAVTVFPLAELEAVHP